MKQKEKIYKKRKNTKLMTSFIISIIVLIMLCGYSMAKCIDEYIIKGRMKVAEPILELESTPSIDITETKNYGEYTFKIKNYNSKGKITETNLEYYIEISPNLEKILNIELYQNNNKIELTNNKTEAIKISKEQKEEREYKIKITYDKNNTTTEKDILEKIQVKVHAEQEKT